MLVANRTIAQLPNLRRVFLTTAVAAATVLATHPTPAHADRTWINGNLNNFWSQDNNWSPFEEPNLFSGVAIFPNPVPNPNGTILLGPLESAGELRFDVGGYTLSGGDLELFNGNITYNQASGFNPEIASEIKGLNGLTKLGSGAVFLTGANSYSGATTVSDSDSALDVGIANERLPDGTDVTIDSGAFLRFFFGTATETIGSLSGDGTLVFANTDIGGTNLRVGFNNNDTTFSGNIAPAFGGDGRLTKIGTGTQTFTGSVDFTGLNVKDGRVIFDGAAVNTSGALVVGGPGGAAMTVSNGAQVSNGVGEIADTSADQGSVVVEDAGSTWTSSGNMFIGSSGVGSLLIQSGGAVNALRTVFIGQGNPNEEDVAITVTGPGSSFAITNTAFVDNGSVTIADGATLQADRLRNSGTVGLNGGTLRANQFENNFAFNFLGGTLITGNYSSPNNPTANTFLQQSGGVMAPGGNAIGTTAIDGNYSFVAGTLEIDLAGLGGAAVTNGHDQLTTGGFASLTGSVVPTILEINLINGFTPTPGDSFIILESERDLGVVQRV